MEPLLAALERPLMNRWFFYFNAAQVGRKEPSFAKATEVKSADLLIGSGKKCCIRFFKKPFKKIARKAFKTFRMMPCNGFFYRPYRLTGKN